MLVEGEACRLLTLVGPGGVGKSRLALAAAERLAPRFADGVAVVALAGVEPDDPDGVADLLAVAVAEALAVPLAARRPARELLGAWLAERRLLVVLDNLEHLDGAAPLVTGLLAAAPGLKLLATSRRRVGAGVEWVLDVPGLAEGAAVELFAERARRVRAGFSLEDEGPAVAAICRLVDGLPLAIELAADLARTLPCQVIADKLVSDLNLLQTTSATVPPRHRSMRSVIEASWRLLDAGQQRALARLSVFRGGFDPAAAEAVAGAGPAMLSALVERSLVDRADGGRYGLHELLRQFATERLEAAGDAAATRRAHAGHYAGFLAARHDRLADAFDGAVLAEVDPETGNLRAAWQELAETGGIDAVAGLLEDLWLVHRRHGRFQEALGMLQRALARDDATTRQRARWHLWAGLAQYQLGRADEGQEELRAMLGLAGRPLPATGAGWAAAVARGAAGQARSRTLGTRPAADPAARQAAAEVAQAYAIVGETYYMAGQLLPMVASGVSTINAAERAGSVGDVAAGYAVTAISARVAGRHRLAGWYGRLADDAIATGTDEAALAYPLEVRGVDHVTVGAWAAAEACLGRAAGSFARMGQPRFWEECTALVAVADCYRGGYRRAVDGFAEVAASARARHDQLSLYWGLAGQAEALLRLERDTGPALELLEEARTLFGDLPASERLRVHAGLGLVHLRAGRDAEAGTAVRAGLREAAAAGMPRMWLGEGLTVLAEVALALRERGHDPAVAASACDRLRSFTAGCPVSAARALRAGGLQLWLAGRRPKAVRAWRRSLDTARRLDLPYDEAMAHLELGRHLRPTQTTPGDWGRDEHLSRSRELFSPSAPNQPSPVPRRPPDRPRRSAANGLSRRTPVRARPPTSRVTKVQSLTLAVAAMSPSTTGSGSGTFSRPHSSQTSTVTGTSRSAKLCKSDDSQLSYGAACAGSRRRSRSIPWRTSPTTSTLRYSSGSGTDASQIRTFESGDCLRASEMTLVSRRKAIGHTSGGAGHGRLELDHARRLTRAAELEGVQVGRGEQELLEAGLIVGEAAVLLDAHDHRDLFAMPGDHLGSMGTGMPDQFTEALLGLLKLPPHAASLSRIRLDSLD